MTPPTLGAGLILGALAAASAGAQTISAGPNVRVSAANASRLHHEVTMAASPTDPNRLLACSMIFDARDDSRHVVAYLTTDGGKSWKPSLEAGTTTFVGDPSCAFGPSGDAYVSALPLHYESAAEHEMLVYRSSDGGETWAAPVSLPFIDREWMVVDQTSGPRRGTLYLHGNAVSDPTVDGDERIVFTFFRSTDRGATFAPPQKLLPDGEHQNLGTGNAVVLSDGAFVACFPEWFDRKALSSDDFKKPIGKMKIVRSKDGGKTFEKAVAVADWHGCEGWTPGLPILAADASDGPFRDRLYLTWPDRRSGRCEILLSYSADKGQTWTPPLTVNDDRSPAEVARGSDHMLPAVAVNPAGVVGVSWSDRREATEDPRQWTERFAASFDGGETFSPSVRVADVPLPIPGLTYLPIMAYSQGGGHRRPKGRGGSIRMEIGPQWSDYLCAADTAGMAAGADGVFHPLWVDHRTAVPQLWTAAVKVDGKAFVNGSAELAGFEDVSGRVAVDFSNTEFDPKGKLVALDVTLTNTSDKTITAPVKLRVVSLKSSFGMARIAGADNGVEGAGALWDFSSSLPGGRLAPGETSAKRRLRFRLDAIGPFRLDKRVTFGSLIALETKLLGKEESR